MTEHAKILARIDQLRLGIQPFCIATIVRTADATSAKAGAKAVVTKDGQLEGYVGGGCVTGAVEKAALRCIESGDAQLIRVKPNADITGDRDNDGTDLYGSGCPSGGTVDVFLEPQLTAARVVVCGNSPVAAALVLLATSVGLHVIHARASANQPELPGAVSTTADFNFESLDLQPRDAIVVVTQGNSDNQALQAAFNSPAEYLGMVGSLKKIDFLKQQLGDSVNKSRLAQLHGPAGLDIGAIAPEEIALSIVAEIVAFRRKVCTN